MRSRAKSKPVVGRALPVGEVISCRLGSGLSADTAVSIGELSVTVRPVRTSRAAASTCAGVMLFSAPRRSDGP